MSSSGEEEILLMILCCIGKIIGACWDVDVPWV